MERRLPNLKNVRGRAFGVTAEYINQGSSNELRICISLKTPMSLTGTHRIPRIILTVTVIVWLPVISHMITVSFSLKIFPSLSYNLCDLATGGFLRGFSTQCCVRTYPCYGSSHNPSSPESICSQTVTILGRNQMTTTNLNDITCNHLLKLHRSHGIATRMGADTPSKHSGDYSLGSSFRNTRISDPPYPQIF